ncbi:protein-glutamate methylesterase/protein-glutamine glutaminase [Bacillus sp. T33-2]|uniref:protein-glutamate methylesterase/protein-glutamine glutaminase n=1 Tax=Bacillus sp. T33-2 TaxID=2054168 RepID=UPI000C7741EB|nr:chemotaxis response regulator protein-glutamate methylesterase [Bacillus sp. T33-2]PLR97259.1 chemotaxis response regulator protein-glutamate methylesterase [Bacillus sp. T33-2]
MGKIKVLVVDDSAFMRKLITDFLSEHPRIEVIGTARNGEDALKKIRQTRPDVVTLDVEMPLLNGIDVLKIIMNEQPVPVVMLSSTTKEGADNTLQAIQAGAVDFVAKPSGAISIDLYKVKEELTEKVLSASSANMKTVANSRLPGKNSRENEESYSKIELVTTEEKHSTFVNVPPEKNGKKLVCIGTSTGGPRALQQVLTRLPENFPAPVLIVQHMPAGFTKSLANRLNTICKITVKEAEDGEILKRGTAYIAPGGYHLEVKTVGISLAASLVQTPPISGHRPSVDVMFESVSRISGYTKIAVIMTGMGADGSKGLVELKKSGNVKTIVESQETSVVFGMPKSAIATRLVDEVKNVETIAEAIMKYI